MVDGSLPEDINAGEYRRVLNNRLLFVEGQVEVLARQIASLEETRSSLAEEAIRIRTLLGVHDNERPRAEGQLQHQHSQRWKSAADVVVEYLDEVGAPVHYREIEKALRERGAVSLGGKDPANSLLARYFADPRLLRVSRGTYASKSKWTGRGLSSRKRRRRRA